jgi:hypothetical protein
MIDFIKFMAFVDSDELIKNPYLKFEGKYFVNTGEVIAKTQIANHFGLQFKIINKSTVIVQGSLHKFYNFLRGFKAPNQHTPESTNKGFNGDTLNHTQLCFVVNYLADRFNINLENSRVLNIEFGLNLFHSFDTNKILQSILLHKGKLFSREVGQRIYYKQAIHTQYFFKCYNKSLQYGLSVPTLRIELKYFKMSQLNKLGLVTVNQLKSTGLLNQLCALLIKKWGETLFIDYTLNKSNLKAKEKDLLIKYTNEVFWQHLPAQRHDRHKKKLDEMTKRNSENVKHKIEKMILETWEKQNQKCVTFYQLKKTSIV